MKFHAVLVLEGKTATGIEVPAEYVALGGGKRPAVKVTLNDSYTYRSTVSPYAGRVLLPVAAEHREAAGLKAGDRVEVTLELDTEARLVAVPDDLARALGGAPGLRAAFDALSPSARKAHVLAVEGAKTPETRGRRIDKVVAALTT
jgi:hypothetical protein